MKWIISKYETVGATRYSKEKVKTYVDKANKLLLDVGLSKNHWIFTFGEYILERLN